MNVHWCWLSYVVNPLAIVVSGLLGLALKNKFPSRIKEYMLFAIALTATAVGLSSFPSVFSAGPDNKSMILLAFITLVVGSALGAWARIDTRLKYFIDCRFGSTQQKMKVSGMSLDSYEALKPANGGTVTAGWAFATATYISLVGVLSITGPIHEATDGKLTFIIMKIVLDTVATFVFTIDWGGAVIWSAVPVFLFQLMVGISANTLMPYFSPTVMSFMDGVGGVIIMAMGLSVAGVLKGREGKDFSTGNFLPAMLVAPIIANIALYFNIFM